RVGLFVRVILQPACILHTRPFNETSMLLDVFSLMYGRVHLLARGARTTHSRLRGVLRPFIPLLLSWSGKTGLMSLSAVETAGMMWHLSGAALLHGIYLNELLVRLLPHHDAHPQLFMCYQQTLQSLQHTAFTDAPLATQTSSLAGSAAERSLRMFEKVLLQ